MSNGQPGWDADRGYLLLDELSYGEETSKLARLPLQDFQQYLVTRKPRERRLGRFCPVTPGLHGRRAFEGRFADFTPDSLRAVTSHPPGD